MKLGETCKAHPDHKNDFICLDSACSLNSFLCTSCITADHSKCKRELIVPSSEKEKSIRVENSQALENLVKESLDKILDDQLTQLIVFIKDRNQEFLKGLSFTSLDSSMNEASLKAVKKNFKMELDPDTKSLKITSKLDDEPESVQNSIQNFELSVDSLYKNFVTFLSQTKFQLSPGMDPADFIGHHLIQVEGFENSIKLKRTPNDSSFNYYCKVYQQPLEHCKFRIVIDSIHESDRFLDIGIIDDAKLKLVRNDFVNSFGSGGISFCGYSHSSMNGTLPTSSHTDTAGFKANDVYFFEFKPKTSLRIYNEKLSTDLSHSPLDAKNYYFYVVLYHPEAACTITRIL